MARRLTTTTLTAEHAAHCASEDLAHTPAIQSAGFILVGDLRTDLLVQLSENAARRAEGGKTEPPLIPELESFLGEPMRDLVGAAWEKALDLPAPAPGEPGLPVAIAEDAAIDSSRWRCLAHRLARHLVLEFLPLSRSEASLTVSELNEFFRALHAARDVESFAAFAASAYQSFSGFDRVMFYRFCPDWTGEVIAEATAEGVEQRYLGLRFPAEDIPPQARDLYSRCGVRVIFDIDSEPVSLVPPLPLSSDRPLNISTCVLRAVSLAHIAYLRNMGVRSSLSAAIHAGGKLWGLIACHQLSDRPLAADLAQSLPRAARLLAGVAELKFEAWFEHDRDVNQQRVQKVLDAHLWASRAVRFHGHSLRTLLRGSIGELGFDLLGVFSEDFACVVTDGDVFETGHPVVETLQRFFELRYSTEPGAFLQTRKPKELALDGFDVPRPLETLAGFLFFADPRRADVMVCAGLRPFDEKIMWGGAPDTVRVAASDDGIVVEPRASFDRWLTEASGRCRYWEESDHGALEVLASAVRSWLAERDQLRLREQVEEARFVDPLTSLPNRLAIARYFADRPADEAEPDGKLWDVGLLLLLEIVELKSINQRFGYAQGDAVLRRVTECLREDMPEEARLARIDADDFLVLLRRRAESPELLKAHAERLRKVIAERFGTPVECGGKRMDVRIATGASVFSRSARFGDALRAADQCLRESRSRDDGAAGVVMLT